MNRDEKTLFHDTVSYCITDWRPTDVRTIRHFDILYVNTVGRTDSHEDRQNDRLQSLDKPLSSHRKSPKMKMEKEITSRIN